jgi:hypothetical protein
MFRNAFREPPPRQAMHGRILIAAITSAAALLQTLNGACAFDDAKYPDWKGQWIGGWTKRFPGVTGSRPMTRTNPTVADNRPR